MQITVELPDDLAQRPDPARAAVAHPFALRGENLDRLRRLWDEGKASGPPKPVDFGRIQRLARARAAGMAATRSRSGSGS